MSTLSEERIDTNFQKIIKSLGATQISTGLVHIGFGVILGLILSYNEHVVGFSSSAAFTSGYPLWAGLFFIVTGLLTASATINSYTYLRKSKIGMNIYSTIFTVMGVIMLPMYLLVNVDLQQDLGAGVTVIIISVIVIISSLVEFFTAVTTIYFTIRKDTMTETSTQASPTNDPTAADNTMPVQDESTAPDTLTTEP